MTERETRVRPGRAIAVAVGLTIAALIVLRTFGALFKVGDGIELTNAFACLLTAAVVTAALFALRLTAGLQLSDESFISGRKLSFWHGLPLIFSGLAIFAVNWMLIDHTGLHGPSWGMLATFVLVVFSTALFEETLYRGGVLEVLRRSVPVMRAALISAILFALSHLLYLIDHPQAIITTGTQVVYTFFIGVFLAGLYLRSGSIWAGVGAHAGFNFGGLLIGLWSRPADAAAAIDGAPADISPVSAALLIILTAPVLWIGLRWLRAADTPTEQARAVEDDA